MSEEQLPIEAVWTPPFKMRDHQAHQDMLQRHKNEKQKRQERHKRTHGKSFVYPGHLY